MRVCVGLTGICLLAFSVRGAAGVAPDVESIAVAVDACTARLDPQIDIGYERIAARCPDLARRLEQNELAAWLPEGWKDTGNNLSVGSLKELAVLMRRELATPATRPAPSVDRLRDVLSEIGQSAQQQDGLWKRMRLWMHKIFPSNSEPTDTGWIPRMISRIGLPQTVIELITYLALALVAGLSLLILTNELRAAGLFRWRTKGSDPLPSTTVTQSRAPLEWQDVERAVLADKPRVVLELLLDRLTHAQRLPPARSLTPREIARIAKLQAAEDNERLRGVTLTAEKARYAGGATSRAEIEQAVEEGRALLNTLEQSR